MLKLQDKIKILKKSKYTENWQEVGRGVIKSLYFSRHSDTPTFVGYSDKEWSNPEIEETISVNSLNIKVQKI